MAEGKKGRGMVMGDFSPLAGAVTGEGITSNLFTPRLMANLKSGNMRGMGGDEEEEAVAVKKGPGMKKGGKVGSSCMKKGGSVKSKPMAKYKHGGMVKADGCAMRGKTKGKEC